MPNEGRKSLADIINQHEPDLITDWVKLQVGQLSSSSHGLQERQLQEESREFLASLREALERGDGRYISSPEFGRVRDNLETICTARIKEGFTPSEVATFIFSLKQPLFTRLRGEFMNDIEGFSEQI